MVQDKIYDLLDSEPLKKEIKIGEKKQNNEYKIEFPGGIKLRVSNME